MVVKGKQLDYVPLFIVLAMPAVAILYILLTEPGINRALIIDGAKLGVALIVAAAAVFGAGYYYFERDRPR